MSLEKIPCLISNRSRMGPQRRGRVGSTSPDRGDPDPGHRAARHVAVQSAEPEATGEAIAIGHERGSRNEMLFCIYRDPSRIMLTSQLDRRSSIRAAIGFVGHHDCLIHEPRHPAPPSDHAGSRLPRADGETRGAVVATEPAGGMPHPRPRPGPPSGRSCPRACPHRPARPPRPRGPLARDARALPPRRRPRRDGRDRLVAAHLAMYPLGILRERGQDAGATLPGPHAAPAQPGLTNVAAASTPILLVHGMIDNRRSSPS